jgi:hypothetical protein
MNWLILFCDLILLFFSVNSGHITAWDHFSEYGYNGQLIRLNFIFKLESGLGENEFFSFEFPFSL